MSEENNVWLALRMALDVMTDAEQYHGRACLKDKAHDHAILRKLRATIPVCEAALGDTYPVMTSTLIVTEKI